MEQTMTVNGVSYQIITLLGHGKGGYSYLARKDGKDFVLKQIHHEPCSYYSFGNKIEAEQNDYHRLTQAGIRMPKMLDLDIHQERILKEYIPGPTIFDLVGQDAVTADHLHQVTQMAEQAMAAGLNIDYFPTNFVVWGDLMYYVDYECNPYMEQWDFAHWGIRYWSKTPEYWEYVHSRA